MTIVTLLNQIREEEIVLPAIQRDFVWKESKIEMLLDSILRGYPIGLVLMWESYQDVQYRTFVKRYTQSSQKRFSNNPEKRKLKLVLDGQQRLQSLYVALYGQYKGKYLYFDVLSGKHSDDFEEKKYVFKFMKKGEANEKNKDTIKDASDLGFEGRIEHYIQVAELFKLSAEEKPKLRKKLIKDYDLGEEDEIRLETNLSKLDQVLTKDQNILKVSVIDENVPPKGANRQTESDVLEIFVRINKQGSPLSRSDLIFSMLKLSWKESAIALPDFVKKVNVGNSLNLDVDFVIRCLFAVSDLGTKFDVNMLRKKSNMKKMQDNFEKCCSAIEATVDNVQKYCWISNNKAMGGAANLVPFVYYHFHLKKHMIPNNQIENFRKAFFLFCFAAPFSRYADSRLGKFIREELKPLHEKDDDAFPLSDAITWVNYWENVNGFNADLVQRNHVLALHIIQHDPGHQTQFRMNTREIDHIFPKSILHDKGYNFSKINHFANYWLLAKNKNINKTNKHPKTYFEDVPGSILKDALIDREMLDYRRYNSFLNTRSELIVSKLQSKIGFSDADFEFLFD